MQQKELPRPALRPSHRVHQILKLFDKTSDAEITREDLEASLYLCEKTAWLSGLFTGILGTGIGCTIIAIIGNLIFYG